MRGVAALALAALVAAVAPAAGRPRPQDQDQQPVTLGTSEVSVDVVVRDKDGRPIKDLTKEDFELSEDGTTQEIASFRLVAREPGAAPIPKDGLTSVSAVALVFDRLTPEGRNLAKKAAESFVAEGMGPSDLVGVFTVDLTMRVVQPFTNDPALVRAALEKVAGVGDTPAVATNQQVLQSLQDRQIVIERSMGSAKGEAAGGLGAEAIANRMSIQSIERFNDLERDQSGHDATDGLLSVVAGLGKIPGRKAVVFFSEGVTITSNTEQPFQNVIGNANRANVSFYAVDAGGLRATSQAGEAGADLMRAGNAAIAANATGKRGGPGGGPLMRDMERNENTMRRAAEFSLRELSAGTGGFLISNTNDPGKKLRQVDDDLRQHYTVTYVPKNQDFDGKFREISVKVRRSGAEVQARRGYYAVNATSDVTLLPDEAPAFAAVYGGKAPASPAVKLLPLSFPEPGRAGLAKVLVRVPASEISVAEDASAKTSKVDFTILAVARDADGRVVTKVSQHYAFAGTPDQIASFRKGDVLFSRDATLPPGDYTIDAVVYDATSKKAEVGRATLSVPDASAPARLSSAIVVERGEKLSPEDVKAPDPLHVDDTLLYPNVGTPVDKKGGKLSFYEVVYTTPGAAAPKLTLEIAQGGATLVSLPVDLPAADAQGRIQVVNALPLEAFPPGTYQLRFVLDDGKSKVTRTTPFTVAP